MNRNQRRYGRVPRRNDSEGRLKSLRSRNGSDLEEIYVPRIRRESPPTVNRCCHVTPDQQDFAQLTESDVCADQYQQLISDQYGFDPIIPDTIKQLRELKKVLCGSCTKIENGSQYVDPEILFPTYVETLDGSQWQSVDNANDIDIIRDKGTQKSASTVTIQEILPQNIRISEVPRIKVIAKKFSRYKKNNIELRKLTEMIVCVEYDIYDESSNGDLENPAQKMRAFFTLKPFESVGGVRKKDETVITKMPSEVKRNFHLVDEDLKNLSEKEIETIDSDIPENKSYLEDLKKLLRRNQVINSNRNCTAINLITLYEMALRDYPTLNFDNSDEILSKAELNDIKDLIMKKCTSSVHGICRKTIKLDQEKGDKVKQFSLISKSMLSELLRDDGKTNVFQ